MGPELSHRNSSCMRSCRVLRKVLRDPLLDKAIRLILTDSLMGSSKRFNTGTWPNLTVAQLAMVSNDTVMMYRAVIKQPRKDDKAVPNGHLLAQVDKPTVAV